MDRATLRYWIGFNRVRGIGSVRFHAILNHFGGDLESAWQGRNTAVVETLINNKAAFANFLKARETADLDADVEAVKRAGARAVTLTDEDYPRLLREISDPPPVIYVRGTLEAVDDRAIGIVGTRDPTEYGLQAARALAIGLARANVTVVSGLAKGIDAAAHKAVIVINGRTFALLGHGIDTIYPAENAQLADTITQHGALITEFPIGMRADAGNFPMRNRLISGLSLGVAVIEAGPRSGALSTARHALEQSREVFAVPGSIFSTESQGTNLLIQASGAKLITKVNDILDEFLLSAPLFNQPIPPKTATATADTVDQPALLPDQPLSQSRVRPSSSKKKSADAPAATDPETLSSEPLTGDQNTLLDTLRGEPLYIDELCAITGLSAARVTSLLTMLELGGYVQQSGPRRYALAGT